MTIATSIYDLTGNYGTNWETGVLVDHLDRCPAGSVHTSTDGTRLWVQVGKDPAVKVVCGDLIPVYTEDGVVSGRCGLPIDARRGACTSHADERDAFLASSEAERMEWERQNDRI